jgi:hypothetical protein
VQSLPGHNAAINETIRAAPFELTYGYHPRTSVGEVVEVVHPASAAFVERLQSSLSFARKCLTAAQQRQKALADKRRVDRVYKVGDRVLLSTKYLNLKHSESSRKLLLKWIGPFEVVQHETSTVLFSGLVNRIVHRRKSLGTSRRDPPDMKFCNFWSWRISWD